MLDEGFNTGAPVWLHADVEQGLERGDRSVDGVDVEAVIEDDPGFPECVAAVQTD